MIINPAPTVSIIVPIHNVEQYLSTCLDSLTNQTYENIEIICINDCSPDNSLTILQEYAKNDARFFIINSQVNIGVGAARNKGIRAATGKYLRMVDPDDFIPLNSTKLLVDTAEKHNSNFVLGGFKYCNQKGKLLKKARYFPEGTRINTSIKYEKTLWHLPLHVSFLFNRNIIKKNNICNDYSNYMEDLYFIVNLAPYLQKVTIIPDTIYYYRNNPTSSMHSSRKKEFFITSFINYSNAYQKLNNLVSEEVAQAFLLTRLHRHIPYNLFISMPHYLTEQEGLIALKEIQTIFLNIEMKQLCSTQNNPWQDRFPVPPFMKQLAILLANNNVDLAWNKIKEENKISRRIQNKISTLYNSISWKIGRGLKKIRHR